MTALRQFLQSAIDYAGLFPPAALPMSEAVANYTRYRDSPESWMLAKFVVPIVRASEVDPSFPLSVLSSGDFAADAKLLEGLPNAGAIEIKTSHASQIETAMWVLPEAIEKYFEITDLSLVPVIADYSGRAKIRTGGVTPEAFPTPEFIAEFLSACAHRKVPFKATAGLHHPLRCYCPLTYADDSPSGWMFGFLNVFAAAARSREGANVEDLKRTLLAENVADLPAKALDKRAPAVSFGSCSFTEPVADLKALNLL